MFKKFKKKTNSFQNVTVDSGSYMDMEVSATGSINANENHNGTEIIRVHQPHGGQHRFTASYSTFSSPWLETTWTSNNIVQFVIFMLLQTFLPFYWSISNQLWDFPLTSLCIQLLIAICLLFIYALLRFHCCFQRHPIASSPTSSLNHTRSDLASNLLNSYRIKRGTKISRSTRNMSSAPDLASNPDQDTNLNGNQHIHDDNEENDAMSLHAHSNFCRHLLGRFWAKFKLIIFPAASFSINMVLLRVGVSQGSMDIHTLLKATEIAWYLILSPFLLTDYPTKSGVISAILVSIGSVCFSWTAIPQNDMTTTIIVCNLLSGVFQPFQILFLRRAARILTVEESETRKMEEIDLMTKGEMTLFYLLFAFLTLIPFQFAFEGVHAWTMIHEQFGAECNWTVIMIGALITFLGEYNLVCLISNVEPLLIGIAQQSEQLWTMIVSMFLGGITLRVCGCVVDSSSDGHQCIADMNNDDINNRYPVCPCWKQPDDIFNGKDYILHWFGLLFITLAFIFYCYLKAKNLHVTNLNIFRLGRQAMH